MQLLVEPYPELRLMTFLSVYPRPLGDVPLPVSVRELLSAAACAPFRADDEVRAAVRDMLRKRGYRPAGRGKPAAEYLARAAAEERLSSINAAVDCGNAVSLHSGIPVSVVDVDRATGSLAVRVAGVDDRYVFNAAGQEIRVAGLPCLFDGAGPCANAVKDAQRTKTDATTTRTLSLVWGALRLDGRVNDATAWYRELVESTGGQTEGVELA